MTDKILTTPEQRRYPRVPMSVTLNVRLTGEGAGCFRSVISDLSPGGMTFKSDAVLENGMTLWFKLPFEVEIRGEVRSVSASVAGRRRYGVRIHKIEYAPHH